MSNVGVSVTLSLDELVKVEELADEVGTTRSKMVRLLVRRALREVEKEGKEKSDRQRHIMQAWEREKERR